MPGGSSDTELSSAPSELDNQSEDEFNVSSKAGIKKTATSNKKATRTIAGGKKRGLKEEPVVSTKAKRARTKQGTGTTTQAKTEEVEEEIIDKSSRKRSRATSKVKTEAVTQKKVGAKGDESVGAEVASLEKTQKSGRKGVEAIVEEVEAKNKVDTGKGGAVVKKTKRKRKTKEEKEAEAMPLAIRTVGHKMFVGAHVSSAGGRFMLDKILSIDLDNCTVGGSILNAT